MSDHMLWIIIGITMLLIVFGSIFNTVNAQFKGFLDLSETQLCSTTLKWQDRLKSAQLVDIVTIENSCRTLGPVNVPETADSTRGLMKEFSDLMVKTWVMTGSGEIRDLWNQEEFYTAFGESQCMMMYIVNFESRNGFTQPIPSTDLQEFFRQAEVNLRKPDSTEKWKYEEFVEESGGLGKVEIMPTEGLGSVKPDDEFIRPNQQYAISVLSPFNGWFSFDEERNPTILLFSSMEFAQENGCLIRETGGTLG